MGNDSIITVDQVSMKFNLASEKFDNIENILDKELMTLSA